MDYIWIFWLFLIGWFGFMMWQSYQGRQKRQKLIQSLEIGDEVTTAGGIIGRVVDLREDRVLVESGPGTRLWILRQAVLSKGEGAIDEGEERAA